LLETGSTQLIRNTAAQQLADVQKTHPDELFNLLTRVIPYLRSGKWETRIAAAKAIGGIVDHAEKFDPNEDDEPITKGESNGNGSTYLEEIKPEGKHEDNSDLKQIKREGGDDEKDRLGTLINSQTY
jgi:TATA-binding protein-associated factor